MTLDIHDPDALVRLGRGLASRSYRFTTVTPATHRRVNARPGNAMAADLRDVFGWSRPFEPALLPASMLELMRRANVLDTSAGLRSAVRVASVGDHLYFHSAFPTDEEDAVFFGPDTVRFVAATMRSLGALAKEPARIIDIGCGAGPGAIELALRHPQAEVLAADINPAALALTAVNARLAGATGVQPCHSSLLDDVAGEFDLVVANPPYVLDPDERTYRHGGGLHGAQLSVDLVKAALPRLRPAGTLMLYTGVAMTDASDPFLHAVSPALDDATANWTYEELDPDVFGGQLAEPGYEDVERIAAVWLVATRA